MHFWIDRIYRDFFHLQTLKAPLLLSLKVNYVCLTTKLSIQSLITVDLLLLTLTTEIG